MPSQLWAQAGLMMTQQNWPERLLSLASNHFAEPIDLMFVFEINALMPRAWVLRRDFQWMFYQGVVKKVAACSTELQRHPMTRVMPARRVLLYPTLGPKPESAMMLRQSMGLV